MNRGLDDRSANLASSIRRAGGCVLGPSSQDQRSGQPLRPGQATVLAVS
jgi:hypothetical protein